MHAEREKDSKNPNVSKYEFLKTETERSDIKNEISNLFKTTPPLPMRWQEWTTLSCALYNNICDTWN